jgi:hypothetical protein
MNKPDDECEYPKHVDPDRPRKPKVAVDCGSCFAPGFCCRNIVLAAGDFKRGALHLDLLVELATIPTYLENGQPYVAGNGDRLTGDCAAIGLPFMPLYRRQSGAWVLWCPNLTRDGKCGDYDNRPALCRSFKPGEHIPCVMRGPDPEGLDYTAI